MSDRYREVMDQVRVTEEMRSRILARAAADMTPAKPRTANRWLPLAACVALVAVGGLALHEGQQPELPPTVALKPPVGIVGTVPNQAVAESLTELEALVGFPVEEVSQLPFVPAERTYVARGNLAEVTYKGSSTVLRLRKSPGGADNSGDHRDYPCQEELTLGEQTVTLKGEVDFSLVLWTDGNYAWSLSCRPGLSLEEWQTVLSSLIP